MPGKILFTTAGPNVRRNRKAPAKRKNGAKSVADPVAAHELELYIENEPALVAASNSLGKLIMRNLSRMILRGTYDSTKAWKAWMPLADEGAKRYTREYGDRFGTGFNKATREMVANSLAEAFESDVRLGAIDPEALVGAVANPRKRKNALGADAMHYALQQKRVPWSKMSRAQIEAIAQEAGQYGDATLAQRARAALARRR